MFKVASKNNTKTNPNRSGLFQNGGERDAFIQPKLNIGKAGDAYEVEADRAADTIVARGNDTSTTFFSPTPAVQRQTQDEDIQEKCSECENEDTQVQQKPLAESITPLVRRQADEEQLQSKENGQAIQRKGLLEDSVQQKPDTGTSVSEVQKQEEEIQEKEEEDVEAVQPKKNWVQLKDIGTPVVTDSVESGIQRPSGNGQPLGKNVKHSMESGFGTDFSGVRVHTDSNAVQMNQNLGAQAFTHGNDIFFNKGNYNPESNSGKHLLAHELTHTVQQGASVQRKPIPVTAAPKMVQGFGILDVIPNWIINGARHIPGYTLFTVLIAYDPLLGQAVERTPINLTEGLMGLVPFGTAIFDKLQEYNIIQNAFDWISGQLNSLNLTTQGLMDLVGEAWEEVSFPYDNIISVITDKFQQLITRIETFASTLVDQILTWIKEALIGVAEPFLAENKAWSLIKKIIHYDPLRDEEVNAPTVEILEDFLLLIGKETELEQMREKGTLQETADWLDTQVGTFRSLLGQLRGLITSLWDAIQPSNLVNIAENLRILATQASGFLQGVWDFASGVALKVLELVKVSLLSWLSDQASGVRGYSLVKVIIGKDPFTQEVVPRTVPNLIRGFMSLMDGGEEQYAQMVETGAIARIVGEIDAAVETLNMTPQSIVQLFTEIWESLSIDDLIHPLDAFLRIIEKFGEPIGRLIAFVAEIVRIVIVAILEIMNFPFDLIGNIITRALEAIEDIKRDPIGFLKNILRALKQGFIQFFENIVTHLINGVTGWLMRELRDAGIPELTDFSLQGVISWVLEVLGITMEKIWEKLAAHPRIGPERVARIRGAINTLEGIWTFIKDVQDRGMAAIWDKIQEQLSNLWNTVLDAVKNFVIERIITQVTVKLLSMLDPTGIMAVINGAIAFFKAIQSFIQYLREMLEVVNSFVNGVADIARGNVATAANYLENTMGQSMPVVVGFLANQVGLSGVGARIGEIIGAVREMVDQALTWLVNKAVDTGMALLDRVMGRSESSSEEETPSGPISAALTEIDTEGEKEKDEGEVTAEEAEGIKNKVNLDHASVINISSVTDGGDTWDYDYIQMARKSIPKGGGIGDDWITNLNNASDEQKQRIRQILSSIALIESRSLTLNISTNSFSEIIQDKSTSQLNPYLDEITNSINEILGTGGGSLNEPGITRDNSRHTTAVLHLDENQLRGLTLEEVFRIKFSGSLEGQLRVYPREADESFWERYFIPDFFDPTNNVFYEIKSGSANLTFNQSYGYPRVKKYGWKHGTNIMPRVSSCFMVRPKMLNGRRIDPTQIDVSQMSFNQIFDITAIPGA